MNLPRRRLIYFVTIALIYRKTIACNDHDGFQCLDDGRCIDKEDLCDGMRDCPDGEDESFGCLYRAGRGHSITSFLCVKENEYISRKLVCDGKKDCQDGTDEENCPPGPFTQCTLKNGKFLCTDYQKCINLDQLCNNVTDCNDGSDEGGLCLGEPPSTCHCDKCIRTPSLVECVCPDGFINVEDNCQDMDECNLPHICEYACINLPGSYNCTCPENSVLYRNGRTCVLLENPPKNQSQSIALLYEAEDALWAVTLPGYHSFQIDRTILETSVYRGELESGFAFHITPVRRDTWRLDTRTFVTHIKVDPLTHGFYTFRSLLIPEDSRSECPFDTIIHRAIDYMTDNIYVACEAREIWACTWDLEPCANVVRRPDNYAIKRIALSPEHGLLFWLEVTQMRSAQIMRSSMSGSNATTLKVLKNRDATFPYQLVVDSDDGRLFYYNFQVESSRGYVIESIKFDGSGERVIHRIDERPVTLSLHENHLFWTNDYPTRELFVCGKRDGNIQDVVYTAHVDTLIYNAPLRSNSTLCGATQRCSDLCLLTSEESENGPMPKEICACANRTELSLDGFTCLGTTIVAGIADDTSKNYLFVVGLANVGKLFPMTAKLDVKGHVEKIQLNNIKNISSMTYDTTTANVYIFDSAQKTLFAQNLRSREFRTLSTDLGNVTKITYDGLGNNIYFINEDTKAIEVLSLTTGHIATLVENHPEGTPTAFCLGLIEGFMVVAYQKVEEVEGIKASMKFISLSNNTEQEFFLNGLNKTIDNVAIDQTGQCVWYSTNNTLKNFNYAEYKTEYSIRRLDRFTDLAVNNGILFYTTSGSVQMKLFGANFMHIFYPHHFNVITEDKPFFTNARMKIAPVTGPVNMSSPCFHNNGGCDHVCLIVNATTYAKRCLHAKNYSSANGGPHSNATEVPLSDASAVKSTSTSTFTYVFYILVTSCTAAMLIIIYRHTFLGDVLQNGITLVTASIRDTWRRRRSPDTPSFNLPNHENEPKESQ